VGWCWILSVSVDGGDWTGPGTATSGATFAGSVGPGGGGGASGGAGAGVGGNVAVLPMSVGMLSWPGGMAGGVG
jgi:hypothetical protein